MLQHPSCGSGPWKGWWWWWRRQLDSALWCPVPGLQALPGSVGHGGGNFRCLGLNISYVLGLSKGVGVLASHLPEAQVEGPREGQLHRLLGEPLGTQPEGPSLTQYT